MTTDYNQIATAFGHTKGTPLKQFAERWTMFKILGDVRGKSVLDLACGSGDYLREFKQRGAARAVGVDLSEKMIELARAQETQQPLGIEYHVGNVAGLGRLGAFDLVTAVYLLVYAASEEELTSMCRAIAANLAPGGRCIAALTYPDLTEQHMAALASTGVSMVPNGPMANGSTVTISVPTPEGTIQLLNYLWSKETYERALRSSGFNTIRWHPIEISPTGIQRLGAEYWQQFLAHPAIAIVEFEA
ncbi:MAG TPA: class I SAM-dependent methyltransferase [Herpetosiphonaceae bacterium]